MALPCRTAYAGECSRIAHTDGAVFVLYHVATVNLHMSVKRSWDFHVDFARAANGHCGAANYRKNQLTSELGHGACANSPILTQRRGGLLRVGAGGGSGIAGRGGIDLSFAVLRRGGADTRTAWACGRWIIAARSAGFGMGGVVSIVFRAI